VAGLLPVPGVAVLVSVSAVTALAGVLLNLLLGLSRVALAMGRRGDLPSGIAHVDVRDQSPQRPVLLVGLIIGGLTLIGDAETTWSFSAFTGRR
jgi:basic amino acid/polyamine antiporter, APA family